MTETWEAAFTKNRMMWGEAPSRSAIVAAEKFAERNARDVLIPGIGYGRNAKPFLERGMSVAGIEISETAIALARSSMHLDIPIHHGSVTDMPFDDARYDGIFSYGLLYLLDAAARAKFLGDCRAQLRENGIMMFTVIAKSAPMFGKGTKLGDDFYEVHPGVKMFFYDAVSVERELGKHGKIALSEIDEEAGGGGTFPFINVTCTPA